MLYPLSYGFQWAELNFCPYKLSNLKFTPLPSLHVDIYSRHVDDSVLFFLHNCPLLIPLHNTAVLIKICRFLINVVKCMQTFNVNVKRLTTLIKKRHILMRTAVLYIDIYIKWIVTNKYVSLVLEYTNTSSQKICA